MESEKLPSIWTDSPCTLSYIQKAQAFEKSKRFEYNSIYYKDDPFKPAKPIDQFMFPDNLLKNFQKQIKDASKSRSKENLKSLRKQKREKLDSSINHIRQRASKITNRLYKNQRDPIAKPRDMFGNRSSFHTKDLSQICKLSSFEENKPLQKKKSSENIYITASKRLDLGRPINFNPGPGKYQIRESLEGEPLMKSKMSSHHSASKSLEESGYLRKLNHSKFTQKKDK